MFKGLTRNNRIKRLVLQFRPKIRVRRYVIHVRPGINIESGIEIPLRIRKNFLISAVHTITSYIQKLYFIIAGSIYPQVL